VLLFVIFCFWNIFVVVKKALELLTTKFVV
jgi:hypothetical protein